MSDQQPSAVIIRPAREEDWGRLWPLLVGMGQVDEVGRAVLRFRRAIQKDAEFLPVAVWQGELTGYAWAHQGPVHLRAGRSSVRLNDLFVTPSFRRRGIGRLLFAAVLRWATERGADWLEWQASAAALPFYARLGYRGQPERDPEHPFFEVTLAPDHSGCFSEAATKPASPPADLSAGYNHKAC